MNSLIIIGAGGHGSVCAEIAELMGIWKTIYFLDDIKTGNILEYKILGEIDLSKYNPFSNDIFISIGDNNIRRELFLEAKNKGFNIVNLVHPSAIISKSASLSKGIVIMPNAVLNAKVQIGDGVIINTASIVEHDSMVSDFTHIAPNVTILGGVSIGLLCFIGGGTVIKNQIKITDKTTIGMGAIVTKNIYESGLYVGVPARKINI